MRADLWGGSGAAEDVCASKSGPPLDGLCLKGGGTFHAAQVVMILLQSYIYGRRKFISRSLDLRMMF